MSETAETKTDVREQVATFLRQNVPQIAMHGGNAAITSIDLDERRVAIRLSGTCNGCGLSPMTMDAIQRRLPQAVEAIDRVDIDTGGGGGSGTPRAADRPGGTDAPF